MASTARGFPYPVGTDRVMDGDNAIQALAQAVNDKLGNLAIGQLPITPSAADTATTVAVTFPAGRFVNAPVVFAVPNSSVSAAGVIIRCWAAAPSTTGCTVGISRSNVVATTVTWLAVDAA